MCARTALIREGELGSVELRLEYSLGYRRDYFLDLVPLAGGPRVSRNRHWACSLEASWNTCPLRFGV